MTPLFQTASAFTLTSLPKSTITRWRMHTDAGLQGGLYVSGGAEAVWLVLHGGPGSGASPSLLSPFANMPVTAWAPDQRSCVPQASRISCKLSVARLVDDLEALRKACGVDRWAVLGGSWGSYLALAYRARYPGAVVRLVLRGSFVGGRADIWGFVQAMPRRVLSPACLSPPKSSVGLSAWLKQMAHLYQFGADATSRRSIAYAWALAESQLAHRGARRASQSPSLDPRMRVAQQAVVAALSRSQRRLRAASRMNKSVSAALDRKVRIQTRLLPRLLAQPVMRGAAFMHGEFPPVALVHGVCDAVCRPSHSQRLYSRLNSLASAHAGVTLHLCCAGHLGHEPALKQALIACIAESRAG